MFKKIALGLAALVVIVLAVGGHYLWSNMDSLVRTAVEKYGSAATQTAVRLDSVKLMLTSGEGSLSGLSVTNPAGFSSGKALYLGSIAVKLDTSSVTGTGPIIIQKVEITQPQVVYDMNNNGDNNLQTIARNTKIYAASFNKNAGATANNDASGSASSAPGRKIIINDLVIRDGRISVSQQLLKGKTIDASLPPIHLTNIGKSEGGATPAKVAELILGTISQNAAKVATSEIIKQYGSLKNLANVGSVKDMAKKNITPVSDQIKGMLGQ